MMSDHERICFLALIDLVAALQQEVYSLGPYTTMPNTLSLEFIANLQNIVTLRREFLKDGR